MESFYFVYNGFAAGVYFIHIT